APAIIFDQRHRRFMPLRGDCRGPGNCFPVFHDGRQGVVSVGEEVGFDDDPFTGGAFDGVTAGIDLWRDVFDDHPAPAVFWEWMIHVFLLRRYTSFALPTGHRY